MSMIDSALEYIKEGFSVFPVKLDKTPLTAHGLKDATQTKQGVREYWTKYPDAGIALVTDGFIVLDFDFKNKGLESRQVIEEKYGLPQTRTHQTGGGGFHYIYKNPNGSKVRNTVAFGGFSGVDIRADGGYIVAPPSHHPSGNDYIVYDYSPIIPAPGWILQLLTQKAINSVAIYEGNEPIPEGRRNQTMASLAGTMRRRGMNQGEIEIALKEVNKRCNPPLTDKELQTIASSIYRYNPEIQNQMATNGYNNIFINNNSLPSDSVELEGDNRATEKATKGDSLAQRIEQWVKNSSGWFSYEEIDKDLGLNSTLLKDNRWQILHRLCKENIAERHSKNNKLYRRLVLDVRLIDFKSGDRHAPLAVKYPFGIQEYFNTYPGNLIVVAGSPDAGKTAFLLNFILLNQEDFSIFYQSSEMGKDELQNRLVNFEGLGLQDWNFIAEERSSNYADVIRPDCINIIDYMEITDNFYMVAEYLKQIHEKLGSGIAIVALQKDPKANQGRGGTFGLEKPRLYLNMDSGQILIRKAKNWKQPDINPNGLIAKFKIVGGCKFILVEDWHKPADEPM